MGIRGRRLLATFIIASLCPAALAADGPFVIQVHRATRPGNVFDVHLLFEETRTQRLSSVPAPLPAALPARVPPLVSATASATSPQPAPGGAATAASTPAQAGAHADVAPVPPVVSTHTVKAELTGRVEVVDINLHGEVSLLITVGKFVSLTDGKELVPAGKVIGLQSDGLDIYPSVRGGGALSEDARAVLKHVHPLEYQLDEVSFGTKTPHQPGDSWNIDAVSVSQIDSNVEFHVDAASVKGKVTLVGAEKSGVLPALRLAVDLAHSGQDRFRKSTGEMFEHADFKSQINLLLPQDPALPPLESQIVTDTHATGSLRSENQGKVDESRLEVDTHTSARQTIAQVAKATD